MTPRSSMAPPTTTKWQPPPERLRAPTTAVEDLYVIGHFGIAHVPTEGWRLRVDGRVEHPLELTLADLHALPAVEVTAVLECYGNPLLPDEPTRRAGNIVWRGVPVATVLERAGAATDGVLWAQGYDAGVFDGVTCAEYLKDMPLDVVRERGLLVHTMNGAALSAEHGRPVRLFVPGYFGTNNVKWLRALTVADRRPEHLFTTTLYQRDVAGTLAPVRDLDVNALITEVRRETATLRVTGWAWGSSPIVGVEVRADPGGGWVTADLGPPVGGPFGWCPFTAVMDAGARTVAARARDAAGRRQPLDGARNACHTMPVPN